MTAASVPLVTLPGAPPAVAGVKWWPDAGAAGAPAVLVGGGTTTAGGAAPGGAPSGAWQGSMSTSNCCLAGPTEDEAAGEDLPSVGGTCGELCLGGGGPALD